MSAFGNKHPNYMLSRVRVVLAAVALVLVCGVVAMAASYARITLRELTQKASAVVEVEVLAKQYPPLQDGQKFPRTKIETKVLRTLKGTLNGPLELDTPGGINGTIVTHVPDGPEFRVAERAIVFVKEPQPGLYMVQDLGLGKFNIVERNGRTFVENPLCPRAVAAGNAPLDEASLLQRSIPYEKFCEFVADYASGRTPVLDISAWSGTLPPAVHQHGQVPAVVAEIRAEQQAAQARRAWLLATAVLGFVALLAALWVRRRRRQAAGPLSLWAITATMSGALAVGAALGGATAHAFVPFEENTVWDLSSNMNGKVADGRIVWRQSKVSRNNPDVFINVQDSFNKWENVPNAILAFTAGGQTAVTNNNSNDTQNIISWEEDVSSDFSNGTLAITFSSFNVGTPSFFVDGDIIFNDQDFNWAPGRSGNAASVSLHEIGHFIGLNHTTDKNTVMFPFDSGILQLSADEVLAAQTLYAGNDGGGTAGLPTGPVAAAEASPRNGPPGLVVSFVGSDSTPGTSQSPLVSFQWEFGDGATSAEQNPIHTYTAFGSYTATLRVTDANGEVGVDTVLISVGANALAQKGAFKLNFKQTGKDGFTASLFNTALLSFKAPKGQGTARAGKINIGSEQFAFDYGTEKGKSLNKSGPKVSVNFKQGIVTFQIKNDNLRSVLGPFGALNGTFTGKQVRVPVGIYFGDGSELFLFSEINFFYKSAANKSGGGKF